MTTEQLPESDFNIKDKVEAVLNVEDFSSKRAAKMDQDDFLLCVAARCCLVLHVGLPH